MVSAIPLTLGLDSDNKPVKLVESTDITVATVSANTIVSGGADLQTLLGSTITVSNVGSGGVNLFRDKTGDQLNFYTLSAGPNTTITLDPGTSSYTLSTTTADIGDADVTYSDGIKLIFGTGGDTEVYHDGVATIVDMQSTHEIGFLNGNVGIGTSDPGQILDVVGTTAGNSASLRVDHTDNSNVGSDARIIVRTGGTGGGDPHIRCLISGGQSVCLGIANGASDEFRICDAADLDSGVILAADTSQNVYIPQTLNIGSSSGIGASIALGVDSTTGGILFPRMNTSQRDLLTGSDGLVIWNTTTGQLEVYDGGWVAV